jgi:anti-sigma factor RsiW
MTKNISMREWEALSAYLDEQLPAKERARLETRLNQAPELRSALEDLRRTRAVLRSQPRVRAPRNFTLTPDMVGLKARPVRRASAYPFFRLASALTGFLFLLVLVGDITGLPARLGFGGATQPAQVAMAPAAAPFANTLVANQAYPAATQPAAQAPLMQSQMTVPQTPTPGPAATVVPPRAAMPVHPTPQGELPLIASGGSPPTSSVTEAPLAEVVTSAPSSTGAADQAYPAGSQPAASQASEAQPGGPSPIRAVEIVLAFLAVGSGLLAFFLRRAGSA